MLTALKYLIISQRRELCSIPDAAQGARHLLPAIAAAFAASASLVAPRHVATISLSRS